MFLVYVVAVVVATVPLAIAASSLQLPLFVRLTNTSDDAFYYLVPALNLAHGLGPTADGTSLTSGFHPLWMGVATVIAKVCECDRMSFFNAIVLTGAVLHAATAVLVFWIGRRFLPLVLAGLIALLYAVHFANLQGSIQGMESPLLAFLLMLFVLVASRPSERAAHRWVLGGILGLAFLARTDAALLIIGWLVLKAALQLRKHASPLAVVRSSVPTALGAAITALPWFVYAWQTYGTIFQNSMLVKLLWRTRALEGASLVESLRFSSKMLREWLANVLWLSDQTFMAVVLAGLALLVISLIYARTRPALVEANLSRTVSGLVEAAVALGCYVLGAGLFYALRFTAVADWYFVPAHVLWAVLGILAGVLVTNVRWITSGVTWRQVALGCVLVVATTQDGRHTVTRLMSPVNFSGGGPLEFSDWIDQNTPADAVIGSRDSGAASYFFNRTVVNLDGLNNDDILAVSRNHSMEQYMDARHIGYIIGGVAYTQPDSDFAKDTDPTFAARRLQVVYSIASEFHTTFLYRVLPR